MNKSRTIDNIPHKSPGKQQELFFHQNSLFSQGGAYKVEYLLVRAADFVKMKASGKDAQRPVGIAHLFHKKLNLVSGRNPQASRQLAVYPVINADVDNGAAEVYDSVKFLLQSVAAVSAGDDGGERKGFLLRTQKISSGRRLYFMSGGSEDSDIAYYNLSAYIKACCQL